MAFERTRRSHREVNVGSESVMGRKLAPKEVCHRFLVRSGRPSVLMLIRSAPAPPRCSSWYAHTPYGTHSRHARRPYPRAVRGQAGDGGRWPSLSDCCVRCMPSRVNLLLVPCESHLTWAGRRCNRMPIFPLTQIINSGLSLPFSWTVFRR